MVRSAFLRLLSGTGCRPSFSSFFGIILVAVLAAASTAAGAQDRNNLMDRAVAIRPAAAPVKQPVASDLVLEGLASYGHYKIFASGSGAKLYTAGIEYDRHSWGSFLGAEMDYTAEILPVVLLDTAKKQDVWGTPTTAKRMIVPGIGISPIGFRMLWRPGRAWKPYLLAKGGMIAFTQKAMSQKATYENFSFQSAVGLQARMSPRFDLRLGLFSDFHFSDAFMVPVNPGLDVMNANLGLVYHLGGGRPAVR